VEGQLDKKGPNAAFLGSGDFNSRLNGNGDGWGYHAGIMVRPNEHHSIGLVYHSMIKIGLSGDVELTDMNGLGSTLVFGGSNFSVGATAPLYLPQNVQLGYAYMPNDKLMLEADAAWYDWFSMRQLGIVYGSLTPAQNGVLQTGNPQIYNPRKTINFGTGANYKQSDRLQWRGGFYYHAASQAESGFSAAFMDLPRYGLTAGFGYALTSSLNFDCFYNAIFSHTRHIAANNTAAQGSYDDFAHIVGAALTLKLGK
jgi:long-chain fatty acid transport protein